LFLSLGKIYSDITIIIEEKLFPYVWLVCFGYSNNTTTKFVTQLFLVFFLMELKRLECLPYNRRFLFISSLLMFLNENRSLMIIVPVRFPVQQSRIVSITNSEK